jgi:hypothetical protein
MRHIYHMHNLSIKCILLHVTQLEILAVKSMNKIECSFPLFTLEKRTGLCMVLDLIPSNNNNNVAIIISLIKS